MTLPKGARGRFVAIGLLLVPLILLANFGVRPLIGAYMGMTDGIAQAEDDIARLSRILSERPSLEASATHLRKTQATAPFLLAGESATLAAAGLQRHLQTVADQAGVQVVSVRVEEPAADGPLERIALLVRLQADNRGLRDLLYALETGTPYLFVEALNVSVRSGRRAVLADPVDVRLTLSGLRTPGMETGG